MSVEWKTLVERATAVRNNAHAPYSGFAVGAAVGCEDGRIFAGANVENASYGLCLCAERSAIAAAVAAGARRFVALAIVTDAPEAASPCGMCRQVLSEFPPSFPVRSITLGGDVLDTSVAALLPHAFEPRLLPGR